MFIRANSYTHKNKTGYQERTLYAPIYINVLFSFMKFLLKIELGLVKTLNGPKSLTFDGRPPVFLRTSTGTVSSTLTGVIPSEYLLSSSIMLFVSVTITTSEHHPTVKLFNNAIYQLP